MNTSFRGYIELSASVSNGKLPIYHRVSNKCGVTCCVDKLLFFEGYHSKERVGSRVRRQFDATTFFPLQHGPALYVVQKRKNLIGSQ